MTDMSIFLASISFQKEQQVFRYLITCCAQFDQDFVKHSPRWSLGGQSCTPLVGCACDDCHVVEIDEDKLKKHLGRDMGKNMFKVQKEQI